MNLQETVELISVLKAAGVKHFKSLEHDITIDSTIPLLPKENNIVLSPKENIVDTNKAVDLINTLKMTPEQLVNQIFPDGAE